MNKQEAIEELIAFYGYYAGEIREECNLAMSALEKQMPKKAIYHHKAGGECALIICPNCEAMLTVAKHIFPLDRYCKQCGQHYVVDSIDWSAEE